MYRVPDPMENPVVIRVAAEQYAWNIHYPGPDGRFGRADVKLVSADNPLGMDKSDPDGKDDIITKVGEYPVHNEQELRNTLLHYGPGETVKVDYVRGNEHRTAEVKIGTLPKNPVLQRQSGPDGSDGQSDDQMPRMFRDFKFPDAKDLQPFTSPDSKDGKEDVAPLRQGRARLGIGVETATPELRKQFHIPANVDGAVIMSVEPGSVAEKIGLKQGDVVLEFNGKPVKSKNDLGTAMESVKWGDSRRIKSGRYSDGSTFVQDRTFTFR